MDNKIQIKKYFSKCPEASCPETRMPLYDFIYKAALCNNPVDNETSY